MTAHFRVFSRLDRSQSTVGTVSIDRGAGTFTVKPHRGRRAYTLPLATVADIVVAKVVKAEIAARGRQ